ncbi:MAG TPA: multicopper oxidase domain-containing protein [Actinocrinis sp.]|uniref:multicopper oxidase family protein n=1 Tax=Actinocrinis sp. TaxID=1920516 RepID=UPI002D5A0A0D|nr:multicopper oxidase domain-containing protein [Actinocrinis sp.]HZU56140.1 multicopper oxidase domain-containing protein [Actinocrinis sp.]
MSPTPSPAGTPGKRGPSRRGFLIGGALGVGAAATGASVFAANNTTAQAASADTFTYPDLLSGTTSGGVTAYTLQMQAGTHEVLSGVTSSTMGFNGSYLGPTMKWTNGQSVQMNVTNNLGADTTVHWHGAHVPAKVDGGPQVAFSDGATWSPELTVNQDAATLWYHPHALGTTAEQVVKGLAGMIIVEDDSAATAALPSDYGVDDIPVILQCLAVDSSGDIKYNLSGYLTANLKFPVLCNGVNVDSTTLTFTATKTRTRLRLLNASPADIITVSRTDGGTTTQIATEQGYLTAATDVTSIRLVAGARAEVVLDLTAAVTLQAVITTGWVKGGSGTYEFLTITPDASDTPAALPASLNSIERYDTSAFTARTITLSQSGLTMLINGVAGTTMAAMESNMITTTLDAEEIWTVTNATQLEHSFHLHDVPFQIVSVDGTAPTGADVGWKDTVEVVGGSTVKIAMKFTDYADSTYMYMLHCHILKHEDEGMMAGLMVESS